MFVAHKTNIKKLAVILISSGFLAACNQVGSNSSPTSSNATEHAAVENTKESQKILQIVNHSSSVIDHINILNESGQVIFKSTTGLNCKNNQDCNVDLNGLITTEAMIAKLYNAKSQLVSMVKLKDNSQNFKYTTIYANDTMFGTQLFKKLIIAENLSIEAVVEQLTKFFNNRDSKVSIFTELGAYYSEQLANGRIHNEAEFYKLLISDMKHGKAISGKKLLARAYVPELRTSLMSCDNELGNKIFDTISPLGKAFGKEAISGIVEEGKAIFNWACPAETVDFKGEFDKINEKLADIQSSIDALGVSVDALRAFIVQDATYQEKIYMNELYVNESDYNSTYQTILLGANESSLVAYFAANGGIDKVQKKAVTDPKFGALFGPEGIFTTINAQNRNIKNLTDDALIEKITYTMIAKCGSASNIKNSNGEPMDIFKETNLCTLRAINMGMYLAHVSQLSRLRMLDVVNAISTAKTPELSFPNGFGNGIGVLWKDVPAIINKENGERVTNAAKIILDGIVFTPSKDLDDMNIKLTIGADADCGVSKFEKTKVFPDVIKYKDESGNEHKDSNGKAYDSITVTMACNGKKPSTRPLLPGGVYHIDTSNNGDPNTWIGMDNSVDWEINEKINPFISPEAIQFNGIIGVYEGTYGSTRLGDFEWMKASLIAQGRDEFAYGLYLLKSYGETHYTDVRTNIGTKLFLPYSFNYDGWKNITIWAAKDYGTRADIYGSSDKTNAYMIQFDGKNYRTGNDAYVNAGGWRKFKPNKKYGDGPGGVEIQ